MLANDKLIGCDPEFIFYKSPSIVNAMHKGIRQTKTFGFDHGGRVSELRPPASRSVREIITSMRKTLGSLYQRAPEARNWDWYAKPVFGGETLGGHIHIDGNETPELLTALNAFAKGLEDTDILPNEMSKERRRTGHYGQFGDVRRKFEGRFEYRTMPSWLFSMRAAMLALTGAKLLTVDHSDLPNFSTISGIRSYIERFKHKDDDADWILEKDYFARGRLKANPDRCLTDVWKVQPAPGRKPLPLEEELDAVPEAPRQLTRNDIANMTAQWQNAGIDLGQQAAANDFQRVYAPQYVANATINTEWNDPPGIDLLRY
jgi:hypothetical protein